MYFIYIIYGIITKPLLKIFTNTQLLTERYQNSTEAKEICNHTIELNWSSEFWKHTQTKAPQSHCMFEGGSSMGLISKILKIYCRKY